MNTVKLSEIRAIIFDLDGTLIDSRADIAAALNTVRAHYNWPALELEAVIPMIGNGLPKLIERGLAGTGIPVDEALPIALEYYREHPSDLTKIYDGVPETLQKLQQRGLPLAIISNKPTALVQPVLQSLKLDAFFDITIGGEDYPERKPSPLAALDLAKRWQLPCSSILMVGDMNPDADMATAAGMPFAFCEYGYSAQALASDLQLQHFSQLLESLP